MFGAGCVYWCVVQFVCIGEWSGGVYWCMVHLVCTWCILVFDAGDVY